MTEHPNGGVSGTHMPEIVESLRAELDRAEASYVAANAVAQKHKDLANRLRKAVEALDGPTRPSPGRPPKPDSNQWSISERKLQQVWDIIRAWDGEFKPTEVREKGGLSGEAVRRALYILRKQELIRVTASTRGGGKLYKMMPGAEDHLTVTADAQLREAATNGA